MAPGEFFCLLGPSGCGKSTLLRMIAGFESPSGGVIEVGGADITALPPHRRPVNMMFQSYALFPHMSVAANIAYGLKGRPDAKDRVADLLRLVRLDGFGERRPDTLSGGQRQRVALARALAREPGLLLLDEPLGALDRGLREETQGELRGLQRRLGTSFVVVTHDPEEAMMLADRIGVMERGRLVQVAKPADLYRRPASRYVAGFWRREPHPRPARPAGPGDTREIVTAHGTLTAQAGDAVSAEGAEVVVAVRPESLILGEGSLTATVEDETFLGDRIRRVLRLPDGTLLRASGPPGGGPERGPRRRSASPRRMPSSSRLRHTMAALKPDRIVARLLRLPPFLWLGAFFLLPFLVTLKISLSEPATAIPPYLADPRLAGRPRRLVELPRSAELHELPDARRDDLYQAAVIGSLSYAGAATLLLALIGTPIAYALARAPSAGNLCSWRSWWCRSGRAS